jgi:AbrB family looped-hinge helix DNA binding protein
MAKRARNANGSAVAQNPPRHDLRVSQGGRIVIPLDVRRQLGFKTGSHVVLTIDGDRATLMSREAEIRRAREWVRKYIRPGVSLSEELMAERKREAERE